MTEAAARAHITRFNNAVTSGDWSQFIAALHPDAVMTFIGPPIGPFHGRDAIARAYAADPPTDTLKVVDIRSESETDLITFEWSRGGTGTLTLHHAAGQVNALTIRFD
ncbi:nuclear transport factor 2 family protein [Actinoplanes aureus]|uniref:Nuclear transport factor 2 family protein n=1 Tax=Actinoplanes aureus TaxID=2792083 RepID=A0A931G525_9ACTN|nr:nuclear transport factor 2 family protein [Actinoplanes aureus]MBG0568501.1 nuclear transport factor 2 family protein [Actinoplanes aureus]